MPLHPSVEQILMNYLSDYCEKYPIHIDLNQDHIMPWGRYQDLLEGFLLNRFIEQENISAAYYKIDRIWD